MQTARIFIIHLGPLPDWMPLWEATARRCQQVSFSLLTDHPYAPNARNISVVSTDLAAINDRIARTVGAAPIKAPYKFCDLRPALPTIFPELIGDETFWGWGDLDVVYGDLDGLLDERGERYDYIATGWNGESGPLAFVRNTEKPNELWRKIEGFSERLGDPTHHALDERAFVEVLKQNVRCDIVFRECMHDLPALLGNGTLTSIASGREYCLHHFGGRLAGTRKQISKDAAALALHIEQGGSVYISRKFRLVREPAFSSPLYRRGWRKALRLIG